MLRFPRFSRVCFVGDSITAAGAYTEFIAQFYAGYLRSSGVRFYVGAVPGGTTASQNKFFEDDILIYNPDHVVIMLGTNDCDRGQLAKPRDDRSRYTILYDCYENYKATLNRLLDRLEMNGISVTLCSPPPYAEYQDLGDTNLHGALALTTAYAEYCRSVALARGIEFCDVHSALVKAMQYKTLFGPDRLHPNVEGHHEIARIILENMGFTNYEPLPLNEEFKEREAVRSKLSGIYAVELMILRLERYELPLEQKLAFVENYLKENRYPDNYFKNIATNYLINKPKQKELYAEYISLTDKVTGHCF